MRNWADSARDKDYSRSFVNENLLFVLLIIFLIISPRWSSGQHV